MADPAPSSELTVGALVAGTYKLTGLLGKGGMGAVWAAEHVRLPGKRVAIKVLHTEVAADAEALVRFRREAEIASRLGHQNIVDVLDFNALPDGSPYLVLEYLEGESLAARLLRGPIPFDQACQFVRQIGSALDAAHAEGIIHRDLKPQNVFLVPRQATGYITEEAKVLDFGISKIRGSNTVKTQDHTMLGTPQYMAPEQATGNHDAVDGRTDVFALGAMVYEMLSGQPAFGGHTIPEVVFKVVYESPRDLRELVPTVTPEAAAAVHKALEKNQDDRFADVAGFVKALTGAALTTLRRGAVVTSGQGEAVGTAATATPASLKRDDVVGTAPTQTGNPMADLANMGVASTGAGAVGAAGSASTGAGAASPSSTGKEAFAATVGSGSQPVPEELVVADTAPKSGGKRNMVFTLAGLSFLAALGAFLVLRPGGGSDNSAAGQTAMAQKDKANAVKSPDNVVADDRKPNVPKKAADNSEGKTGADDDKKSDGKANDVADPKKADPDAKPKNGTTKVVKTDPPDHKQPKHKRSFVRDRKRPRKKLNPKVVALLKQANAALGSGNAAGARHLARRAMTMSGPTSAAYAIIAKSYCKQQNLGLARANLRNVRGRLKYRVKAYCKRQGVEFID